MNLFFNPLSFVDCTVSTEVRAQFREAAQAQAQFGGKIILRPVRKKINPRKKICANAVWHKHDTNGSAEAFLT